MDRGRLFRTVLQVIRASEDLRRDEKREFLVTLRRRPIARREILGAVEAKLATDPNLADDDGSFFDDIDWNAIFEQLLNELIEFLRSLFGGFTFA